MSDQHFPKRKSLRLARFDYASARAYFVTICILDRQTCLSTVQGADVILSNMGTIVQQCWSKLPQTYRHIQLDEFIIMPDHVHGILILEPEYLDPPADHVPGKTPLPWGFNYCPVSLSEVVRAFKTESAKAINRMRCAIGAFWQRGFYDRIIREEEELGPIRSYIRNNPAQKQADDEDIEEWLILQKSGRVAKT
jgi:putative transposase